MKKILSREKNKVNKDYQMLLRKKSPLSLLDTPNKSCEFKLCVSIDKS